MKAVVFGDGVLTNSIHISYAALVEIFNEHSLNYDREERFNLILDTPRAELKETIKTDYEAQRGFELPDDFFSAAKGLYHDMMENHLQKTKGIEILLDRLKAAGIPFMIASNDTHDMTAKHLIDLDLYDYFADADGTDRIIASGDSRIRPKPEVHMYNAAAKQLGVDPSECLIIEANPLGVRGASKSGGYVIGYTEHHYELPGGGHVLFERGASELVKNPAELTQRIFRQFAMPVPRVTEEELANAPEHPETSSPLITPPGSKPAP